MQFASAQRNRTRCDFPGQHAWGKMFEYKQTNRAINNNSELRPAAEELINRTSDGAARAQKRTVAEFQRLFLDKIQREVGQGC